jgi:hypothetical protein
MAGSTGPNIITDGLVLALDAANKKSYPGTGIALTDLSGQGNDGTLTNGPTFNSANGGSLVFDGVNDHVIIEPLILVGDFSITQTLNITNSIYGPMPLGGGLSTGGVTHKGYVRFLNTAIGLRVNGETGRNFIIDSSRWIDTNISYTFTRTGTTIALYLNGELEDSNTISTNNFDIRTIGYSYNLVYSCNGKIYSTQIYDRALSASEILQNYNTTKTRYNL